MFKTLIIASVLSVSLSADGTLELLSSKIVDWSIKATPYVNKLKSDASDGALRVSQQYECWSNGGYRHTFVKLPSSNAYIRVYERCINE